MGFNKFVSGADILLDLTDSTVAPETLAQGETAYDKYGNKITGTLIPQGSDFSNMLTGTVVANAGKTLTISGLSHKPQLVLITRKGETALTQLEPIYILYNAANGYQRTGWINTQSQLWRISSGNNTVTDDSFSITYTNSMEFVQGHEFDYYIWY